MSDLDKAWAERWIRGCAEAASEHREELIDLDRAIGDADHGENVDRGFQAVVKKLDDDQPQDIAGVDGRRGVRAAARHSIHVRSEGRIG